MKYQYFISSRLRNKDLILDLLNKLRAKNKIVYYFMESDTYHSQDQDPEEVMKNYESTPNWWKDEKKQRVFT